jgi:hypothetical protein
LKRVKAFKRSLFASLVVAGMLGFAGCGPDNESEGQNLSSKIGDPGKANPDSIPKTVAPVPKSDSERGQRGPGGTASGAMKGQYQGGQKK